jgi:hypothetical protein
MTQCTVIDKREDVYFKYNGRCSWIAGPSGPVRVYVATGVMHPCYAYGSDLKHNTGGSAINKGKLEKLTTMGSRCNGPPKC